MKKIHLVYFSPGGTTKRSVQNIANSIHNYYKTCEIIEHNMLHAETRKQQIEFGSEDLVILGLMTVVQPFGPVDEIFKCLKGKKTPLVCVAMFGNGMYGNSLKIMKRQVEKRGFYVIAAAAFVGQLSYTNKVATNRPDKSDVELQQLFGAQIALKLESKHPQKLQQRLHTDYPSNTILHWIKTLIFSLSPVGKMKLFAPYNGKAFTSDCIQCGLCERICPVGAINHKSMQIDHRKCIGCVACFNTCPQQAIKITSKTMLKVIENCETVFAKRREPEIFL